RQAERRRARLHERAGQRPRGGVAIDHLRLPQRRRRLARGRRRCGGTPRARGLDRLRLVTRRYAAPAAFLLAVTIAVLAIHYGLQRGPAAKAPVTATAAATPPPKKRKPATTRYYVVQRGDSF